ncbi:hypothetical protein AYK25_03535 [Thermoplasmatales archaeon SM1-50]|nr:MAG: hypothetical protein AYK25_03535 [Thermoplasmatales archaeon SM1-50]
MFLFFQGKDDILLGLVVSIRHSVVIIPWQKTIATIMDDLYFLPKVYISPNNFSFPIISIDW